MVPSEIPVPTYSGTGTSRSADPDQPIRIGPSDFLFYYETGLFRRGGDKKGERQVKKLSSRVTCDLGSNYVPPAPIGKRRAQVKKKKAGER